MAMSEFDSPNYVEYVYDKKKEGKVKLQRNLMLALYIVFAAVLVVILCAIPLYPVIAVVPVLVYILVLCTWRLVCYDVYYEFREGRLELGKIKVSKQGRRKNPKLSIHIKEAAEIAPYESASQIEGIKTVFDYSESPTSDKRIFIIFDKEGERCAAIIEGTAKIGKLFTSFCQNAHDLKGKDFHG